MSTKSGTITVGTSSISLLLSAEHDSQIGQRWTAYNAGGATIWTGDSDVVIGEGIPIPAGGYANEDLQAGDTIYGIAEEDTQLNVKQNGV